MTHADDPATAAGGITTVLSAEQVSTATEWVQSGRVRLSRRVVSETRTIEVVVRREILVVDTADIAGTGPDGGDWVGTDYAGPAVAPPVEPAPFTVVLREEVPQVSMAVQAYERATLYRRLAVRDAAVDVTARHEELQVETTGSAGRA